MWIGCGVVSISRGYPGEPKEGTMRSILKIGLVVLVFVLAGCSIRPISSTINAAKKMNQTAGKAYRTTKSMAELANPLEYVYLSEQAESRGPSGSLTATAEDSVLVYDEQASPSFEIASPSLAR